MSRIKLFALGGLGENGKNMYCLDINNEIIVFDVGFKYPDETMYGIDFVVPEFKFLKENSKRVKALFLSHCHMDNIGAVNDFVEAFPNVPIYTSNTTAKMVEYILKESNLKSDMIKVIKKFENVKLGKISVYALPLTHSAPENFGFAVNTDQGIMFYGTDFIFDNSATGKYSCDIGRLAHLGKQNVLCFMGESLQVSKIGHTSPLHRISDYVSDFLESAGRRAFVMIYSSNYTKIQEVLSESKTVGRKVIIYGKRLTEIVNDGIDDGIFDFDKKDLVSVFDFNKYKDEVTILVSGERDRPFSGMSRIISNRDKYVSLSSEDSVLIAASPVPNTEIESAEVITELYRSGAQVSIVNKKVVRGNHASKEDLLLMLNILKPKYFFPIKGEYRHMVASKEAALSFGLAREQIILADNGQVIEFENGKMVSESAFVPVGDMLVDGNTISEGEIVLKDREVLKENGIIIISCALNFKQKKIIAGPEIVTRGFIYIKENKEYIDELKGVSRNIIEEMLLSSASYNDIQKSLRDGLSKHIYDEKGRKPMILTLLQTI